MKEYKTRRHQLQAGGVQLSFVSSTRLGAAQSLWMYEMVVCRYIEAGCGQNDQYMGGQIVSWLTLFWYRFKPFEVTIFPNQSLFFNWLYGANVQPSSSSVRFYISWFINRKTVVFTKSREYSASRWHIPVKHNGQLHHSISIINSLYCIGPSIDFLIFWTGFAF